MRPIVSYTRTAKFFHWIIAVAVIAMLTVGLSFSFMSDATASFWVPIHKSLGLTILILMILRLGWRIKHKPPMFPLSLPRWQRIAARTTHALLYICIICMVLIGWGVSSYGGHPVYFWGWFNVTWPVAKNKAVSSILAEAHEILGYVILGLILLHIAAAIKHHWINKDNVLKSMLP